MKIKELYYKLLAILGKQNWWPVRYRNTIREGYDYRVEIIVGAILTQNTKWKTVEKVLHKNYDKVKFTLDFFINSKEDEIISLFKGVNFVKRKVKTIKLLFNYIKNNYGSLDEFAKLDENKMRNELLSIYGIGKETADVIMLYAFNKKTFPSDKYSILLFNRLGITTSKNYETIRRLVLQELDEVEALQEFHALIDVFCKT